MEKQRCNGSKRNTVYGRRMVSSGLGYRKVASSCEYGNGGSGSIKHGKFRNSLIYYQLLKKDLAARSQATFAAKGSWKSMSISWDNWQLDLDLFSQTKNISANPPH